MPMDLLDLLGWIRIVGDAYAHALKMHHLLFVIPWLVWHGYSRPRRWTARVWRHSWHVASSHWTRSQVCALSVSARCSEELLPNQFYEWWAQLLKRPAASSKSARGCPPALKRLYIPCRRCMMRNRRRAFC